MLKENKIHRPFSCYDNDKKQSYIYMKVLFQVPSILHRKAYKLY